MTDTDTAFWNVLWKGRLLWTYNPGTGKYLHFWLGFRVSLRVECLLVIPSTPQDWDFLIWVLFCRAAHQKSLEFSAVALAVLGRTPLACRALLLPAPGHNAEKTADCDCGNILKQQLFCYNSFWLQQVQLTCPNTANKTNLLQDHSMLVNLEGQNTDKQK